MLADLGLQLIASTNPEPEWLAELTGEQLFDVMLTNAANISERGRLWALVATRTPAGDIAAHFVEVGRALDRNDQEDA